VTDCIAGQVASTVIGSPQCSQMRSIDVAPSVFMQLNLTDPPGIAVLSHRGSNHSIPGQPKNLLALWLVILLLTPWTSSAAEDKTDGTPWIATASIFRNGGASGSGVYLRDGLILTAAHLTDANAEMSVHLAGAALPATVVKQGVYEDIDLSLLSIDEAKLPTRNALPKMNLCKGPPWPGNRVLVVDASQATSSHIVSPRILPFGMPKFTTLIADVATTGNSGSGVFDPDGKCLLGIMSAKITTHAPAGDKDIAKYFVGADRIRVFMPAQYGRW
jgi:S1-C subfamily serine protease